MKLFNKIFTVALAGCIAFASCVDLDTAPTGGTLTSAQKAQVVEDNPDMVSASVNGITSMFSIYMNAVTGYSRHNDFGYPSIMLLLDARGTDLVGEDVGYNWFGDGLNLIDDRSHDYVVTPIFWNTLYNQIFTANMVTGMIDASTEDSTLQFYLAQALAIRAFDYFNLAQIFAFNYKGHENDKCVPIITDENSDDVALNGAPRATVQQVYDQILKDINTAVDLLGKTDVKRADKRYVDLAVALGIRARINLVMQNWSAAEADAQAAIEKTDAKPMDMATASKPGLKKMTEGNWMWGIAIAETDRVVTSGIVNWSSHMGSLNYGYATVGAFKRIGVKLFNQIPESDVRRGWWLDANKQSVALNDEQSAYLVAKGAPAYAVVKFAPYKDEVGTSTNSNDILLMRVEEMYLILAEAQAMNGKEDTGAATLQTFVSTYRDPEYTCTAKKAEAIQDAVWMQRRIELWGEGLSYSDIMRRGKGFDRRGYGFQPAYVFNIAGDDPILLIQVCEAEVQANPQMDESDYIMAATPTPVDDEN